MSMHYINTNGLRGNAMGGLLLDLQDVKAVGVFWPATDKDSARFDVYLADGRTMTAVFDNTIPVHRQLEEHARLVKELVKVRGITGPGQTQIREVEFEPAEKSLYDATDPDGAWLMTGKALGAYAAYLYQMDDPDHLSGKEEAIRMVEQFAVKAFGDSLAMDEFAKAREQTVWDLAEDDPDRSVAKGFGKPL
ncbi:TPA: hypothetical protein R5O69_004418 [Enterobacter hormaechei]|nr:hypothetical protein [Enterobacter hormaechei]HED5802448.1 hypothetical protein [Enterobacter hormaechei]HED5821798.1 hypothetical protein [Enterobacter hormaechei]